ELALEKTEGMTFDEEKLKTDSLIKEGMALAGSYLANIDMSLDQLKQKLSQVKPEDMATFRKGMANVVISNIVLPQDALYSMRFERLCQVAGVLDSASGDSLMQLKDFLDGYLQQKEEFAQSIQQKLQADQVDPSQFSQIIQQNLKRLDAQYQETLDRTKQTLENALV
ncbi:MAG: hypothetical protein ACSW73_04005, partial [Spirochaetales bacterium]